jgi:hypothetical protein
MIKSHRLGIALALALGGAVATAGALAGTLPPKTGKPPSPAEQLKLCLGSCNTQLQTCLTTAKNVSVLQQRCRDQANICNNRCQSPPHH